MVTQTLWVTMQRWVRVDGDGEKEKVREGRSEKEEKVRGERR